MIVDCTLSVSQTYSSSSSGMFVFDRSCFVNLIIISCSFAASSASCHPLLFPSIASL